MALHEIVYASTAVQPLEPRALHALLGQSRRDNTARAITGMLVYHAGAFLQLLEGEQAVVSALYETIARDSRHQSVNKIWDAPLKARSFADWSMAFASDLAPAPAIGEGYVLLSDHDGQVHGDDATGKKLLLSLRDHLLRRD